MAGYPRATHDRSSPSPCCLPRLLVYPVFQLSLSSPQLAQLQFKIRVFHLKFEAPENSTQAGDLERQEQWQRLTITLKKALWKEDWSPGLRRSRRNMSTNKNMRNTRMRMLCRRPYLEEYFKRQSLFETCHQKRERRSSRG